MYDRIDEEYQVMKKENSYSSISKRKNMREFLQEKELKWENVSKMKQFTFKRFLERFQKNQF